MLGTGPQWWHADAERGIKYECVGELLDSQAFGQAFVVKRNGLEVKLFIFSIEMKP